MGSINIRRDITDPFYRYKMEPLVSKIEGKGNGIKSVIVNLSSVANSLARNPQYVVKYFGFELGAQVKTNPTDDRWIINGAHEASKLQDHLDGFIKKFVLCQECKNPETDLKITKDNNIIRDCKACGQRTPIDMRQRLSGFILKNPPNDSKKGGKSSKKARKTGKADADADADGKDKKEKGSGNNSEEASQNGDEELYAGSDDEFTKKITAEAKTLAEAEVKDDDDWAVDMSEEAVAARAREVAEKLKTTTLADEEDDEAGEENPYEQLGSWIVAEREAGRSIDDVEVYKKAQELGVETKHKTLQVLAQTLFTEKIATEIEPRAPFLKKLISSDRHEKAFLGGIERFIGLDHPALIKQVPTILMNLYQEDLITEDTLNKWGTRASKKYVDLATSKKVRKAAEPFLTWLAEAQSDDEDDDEDDE